MDQEFRNDQPDRPTEHPSSTPDRNSVSSTNVPSATEPGQVASDKAGRLPPREQIKTWLMSGRKKWFVFGFDVTARGCVVLGQDKQSTTRPSSASSFCGSPSTRFHEANCHLNSLSRKRRASRAQRKTLARRVGKISRTDCHFHGRILNALRRNSPRKYRPRPQTSPRMLAKSAASALSWRACSITPVRVSATPTRDRVGNHPSSAPTSATRLTQISTCRRF